MLCIYKEHTEHILGTYLQYADNIQYIPIAPLPIGVKGRRKRKEEEKKKVDLELPLPMAGS